MGLKAHVERLRWSCLSFWLVQLLQENMNLSTNLWSVRFHCFFFRQQVLDLEHLIYSLLHLSLFKANLFVLQSPTFKQKAPACCLLRRASISRLGIVGQLRVSPRNWGHESSIFVFAYLPYHYHLLFNDSHTLQDSFVLSHKYPCGSFSKNQSPATKSNIKAYQTSKILLVHLPTFKGHYIAHHHPTQIQLQNLAQNNWIRLVSICCFTSFDDIWDSQPWRHGHRGLVEIVHVQHVVVVFY